MRDGLEQKLEREVYDSGLTAQRLIVIARIMDQDLDRRVEVPGSAVAGSIEAVPWMDNDINTKRVSNAP